jgi:hypothetical protein
MAGNLISRTHLHPVDAALNFQVTKPFKALGRLVTVDPAPTPNPLANMGQGPSVPAAAMSGPTTMPASQPVQQAAPVAQAAPLTPLELTRSLKAQNMAKHAAAPPNAALEPVAGASVSSLSPQQAMKVKMLVQQGIPEAKAVELAQSGTPTIPQKTLNELAIQARRAGIKLTEEDYTATATLVSEGTTPADAIAALARIKPRP